MSTRHVIDVKKPESLTPAQLAAWEREVRQARAAERKAKDEAYKERKKVVAQLRDRIKEETPKLAAELEQDYLRRGPACPAATQAAWFLAPQLLERKYGLPPSSPTPAPAQVTWALVERFINNPAPEPGR